VQTSESFIVVGFSGSAKLIFAHRADPAPQSLGSVVYLWRKASTNDSQALVAGRDGPVSQTGVAQPAPRGRDPRSVVKWTERQDIILPGWNRFRDQSNAAPFLGN
jgi:hypothetical protein